MRDMLKRVWEAVATFATNHPVKVRAGVAAVLLLVGQYVPAVADYAGSDTVVDIVTGALLALLAGDAVRAARKNRA